MFVKLTRLDSSPIWINASFVVTIEPRKGGGAVVVPIGDGLDYDVRESPEAVLALLAGAPAPAVVPVPAPKGLAPSQPDVTPDDLSAVEKMPEKKSPAPVKKEPAPAKKDTTPAKKKEPADEEVVPANEEIPDDLEPVADTEPAGDAASAAPAADPSSPDVFASVLPTAADGEKPAAHARARKTRTATARRTTAKKTPLDLDDDQLARLRKLAPSSVRKLQNTLLSQFRVADSTVTITALEERGFFSLDRDHVVWRQEPPAT